MALCYRDGRAVGFRRLRGCSSFFFFFFRLGYVYPAQMGEMHNEIRSITEARSITLGINVRTVGMFRLLSHQGAATCNPRTPALVASHTSTVCVYALTAYGCRGIRPRPHQRPKTLTWSRNDRVVGSRCRVVSGLANHEGSVVW